MRITSVSKKELVKAVETGRDSICLFASSILLFICLKLRGLKNVGETRASGVGAASGLFVDGAKIEL